MSACAAGRVPCHRAPVALLTVGCLHEHVRTGPVCAYHLQRHENGRLCCRACLDHPTRPHDKCPTTHLALEAVA